MPEKKKKTSALVTLFLGILSIWLGTATPVSASAEITLTVKNPDPYTGNQSWFVYEKRPGEVIEDIASIKNFGNEPALVRIYPVDAATNSAGSFILKFDNEEQAGIGAWTEMETRELTVQPDQRIDIPFKISIPADVSPGQYIGGVVIEYEVGKAKNGEFSKGCTEKNICATNVGVKTRIGSRIYLTIPGEIKEDIRVTDFRYGPGPFGKPHFTFTIVNGGNIAYEPRAEIEIRDGNGNLFEKINRTLGVSMPNSTIEPVVSWDKKTPFIGNFSATAKVTFPKRFQAGGTGLHGAASVKSISFIVLPWTLLIFIAGAALGFAGCFGAHRARLKKILAGSEKYTVSGDENIMSLAGNRHIDWKLIARINKLKPPYVLRKGDKILLPKNEKKQ